MTTATTPRPPSAHGPASPGRPTGPVPPAAMPQGVAPIDPIKLLKQHAPLLLIAMLLGSAIGVAAHFALMRVYPVYKASVFYQCTSPLKDLTKTDFESSYSQDEMDRFMGTQAALLTSEQVLQAAAKDPEVQQTTWARQFTTGGGYQANAAAMALEDRLSARVVPMSYLIRLTCTWRDPVDAATIVNAVNRAYLEDFRSQAVRVTNDQREVLGKRLADIRLTKESLNSQREHLIEETGLTADNSAANHELLNIQSLQAERTTVMGKVSALSAMLEEYRSEISKSGVIHYPDRVNEAALTDPNIREMDRELSDLKSREQALLMQGTGANHPDIKAIRTLIESKTAERDKQLEETKRKLFTGDMDNTQTSLGAQQAQLDLLDSKIKASQEKLQKYFNARLRTEQIKDQMDRLQTEQADADNAIKQLDALGTLKEANRVRVIRTGQTPSSVSFPKLYILLPAGGVLLPMLVAGLLFLRELFDQRVRGPADLSLIPRLRVLGVVPDAAEDPARPATVATAFRDSPASAITESFRQIRAPLAKKMEQAGHKSLLVIPGMPGSGGTSTATNLAIGTAASEQRVLIIDANFRRPGIHKVFGLSDGPGLGDVLAGATPLESAIQSTPVTGLSVLCAGSAANRALPERLATDTMARLIRDVSERYGLVIIDAPPAIVSGDGLALANRCDAVVLVARAMGEKRGLVARLQAQLADSRGEFLGVILNAVRASAGGYFKRNIKATHEYQSNHKA